MGQHSGAGAAGVRGKITPFGSTTVIVGDDAAEDPFDPNQGDQLDISALAAPHVPAAINQYVKTMNARKASHTAKVQAATKILEYAGGKPGTKEPEKSDGGLTIHIHRFYANKGDPEPEPAIDITPHQMARETIEAELADLTQPRDPTPDLAPVVNDPPAS